MRDREHTTVTVWGDIVASGERFAAVGARHDLQLVTALVPGAGTHRHGPMLAVEVHSEGLDLVMRRTMPARDGAEWIDVLLGVLDVPTRELPSPEGWASIVDQLVEHRRALAALPVHDPRRD